MKLLLDGCVDESLRLLFRGHECQSARFAKLAGLKNGRLLIAAERAGFQVPITVDQSIPDQQNFTGRVISVVVLCASTNRLHDLEPLVPAVLEALTGIRRGEVIKVKGA